MPTSDSTNVAVFLTDRRVSDKCNVSEPILRRFFLKDFEGGFFDPRNTCSLRYSVTGREVSGMLHDHKDESPGMSEFLFVFRIV